MIKSKLGWYCYVYIDPRNSEAFYVGKGKQWRAWAHLKPSAPNIFLRNKITQIRSDGCEPLIEIIQVASNDDAMTLERILISHYGRRDLATGSLLNYTSGGEGSSGRKHSHTEETKKRISEKLKGRVITATHRQRISEGNKGKAGPSEATLAKIRQTQATPEYRASLSERVKASSTPEHLARMTEQAALVTRGKKLSAEQCQLRSDRMRNRVITDQMRANMSAGQKKRYSK